MHADDLRPNVTVYGPLFPEPVQVIVTMPMGDSIKLIGKGIRTNRVYEPILSTGQLEQLHASPAQEPFDGDATKFRLGVEAMRLGLAYEYDPYFSLSIARVDPLPHQLEAVYDYFIKLPRIRFLLADDPGAGKTIMAGLLIKELKIRGLVKRTLIVTPCPLFETVREELLESVRSEMERGAVFYDVHRSVPARLAVYSAAIRDGLGHVLHRRLFIVQEEFDGTMTVRQPTLFLDLVPAPKGAAVPIEKGADQNSIEHFLVQQALEHFLADVTAEREKEVQTVMRHLDISLNELILRQNLKLADLISTQENGDNSPLLAANTKQAQDRLDELFARLEGRKRELQKERNCTISDIQRHASAWVLPHPDRATPGLAAMVRDDEIEHIAVDAVIAYERARGCEVESVESDNRGFDLISRRPHPEDPKTAIEVRFIEVKGRSTVGEVALSSNEYRTAQRLKKDYWLYVVFNCCDNPAINVVRDPAQLDWQPIVKIEHYLVKPQAILNVATDRITEDR